MNDQFLLLFSVYYTCFHCSYFFSFFSNCFSSLYSLFSRECAEIALTEMCDWLMAGGEVAVSLFIIDYEWMNGRMDGWMNE